MNVKANLALSLSLLMVASPAFPANHREAPITAFDHKADITDVYAFRSYDGVGTAKVTLILCVDPLQEPGNGPNWFPFDPGILYEIKIDNNNDAVEDIVFQVRFTTEQRLPNLFQAYAGAGSGINAPANSPAPVAPGTQIVPPQITNFNSAGLGTRQTYTVTMVKGGTSTAITGSTPFYAVPENVGPRTMDYNALFTAGTYTTNTTDVKVFAGTVDDPFWIDLGAAFDTLNLRSTVAPGALSPAQDSAKENFASDTVSGYSVNAIAIEVPVTMLTSTGAIEAFDSTKATIGVFGTTSRVRTTVRRAPLPEAGSGGFSQIQRMGNPLINELLVGTGFKDRFSMDQPKNDSQFANFFLDPTLARILNAATAGAIAIPTPPRNDLFPLVTYAPPIAAPGTPAGPVADLLRLNTGVAPTSAANINRLGLLGGDLAGYPNGRRLQDDVTDISLRVVSGVLAGPPYSTSPLNSRLGDGVNVNDAPYRTTFPYLANAPSGRDRRTSIQANRVAPPTAETPALNKAVIAAFLFSILSLYADAPPSFEEQKISIRGLLKGGDYKTALDRAIALNKQWPDDVIGYQLLTAARFEMGDYAEAEKSAQWMIDMRIGKTDAIGWTLVARIREATGDIDGAIDALNTAFTVLTPTQDSEKLEIIGYSGELHLKAGKLEIAGRLLENRIKLGADASASAALAAVRISQGKSPEGIALLREVASSDPHPRYLFRLAQATGMQSDYAAFASAAESMQSSPNNANRELVVYLSGLGKRKPEALSLALREAALRHDIATQDALAVAYFANGQTEKARTTMRQILAVGTRDPQVLLHAAELGIAP